MLNDVDGPQSESFHVGEIEQPEDGNSKWLIAMEFYYGAVRIEPDPETNLIRLRGPKDYRCFLVALQTSARNFGWEE